MSVLFSPTILVVSFVPMLIQIGIDIMLPFLGKDGTAAFKSHHSWVNYEGLLEPLLVGFIID